ncbi:hypothetical protein CEP54_015157 [Fusarium duplospermum]|uniref:Uncharacterized protein n=1 Tax=Fusarium duplospermum TaxID=1325734 RepID=A0A428NR45_9HYPO|nr:hypothetical protein CEP54_015157 [Fusarium duplospermum]
MPNLVEADTWSTVARSGSPRPPPNGDNVTPPSTSGSGPVKPSSEEEQKRMQDELLFGIGAHIGTEGPKPASG